MDFRFTGLDIFQKTPCLAAVLGPLRPGRLFKTRFMDTQHIEPRRTKVKSHMVQFIFEQVSLVTRASFWLPMNLTSMGGVQGTFDCLGRVTYATA